MIDIKKNGQLEATLIKEKTSIDNEPNKASLGKDGTAAAVILYEY